MLLDVRMKIHCSAPFTTLRFIRRANAAEASAAVMTLKNTPCLLVITQYVCISQSPQSRKTVRACWFFSELGSGGLCFLALGYLPRSCCGGEESWRVLLGAGPAHSGGPLAGHSETRLILAELTVQLFTQNVKAQAALEA